MTTVGIIGLSRIVSGHPSGDDHLKAIPSNATILAYEPNRERLVEVMQDNRVQNGATPEHVSKMCDILLIASPCDTHADYVRVACKERGRFDGPKVILCEKPLAQSYEIGRELVELAGAAGIHLLVNFQRRWAPGVQAWCDGAKRGEWGELEDTLIEYRGAPDPERFRRDACHGLDLAGACGIPSKKLYVDLFDHKFSAAFVYEESLLTVREVTTFRPVWNNIFATLAGKEQFVCTAADCLPGMKLVDELCPRN